MSWQFTPYAVLFGAAAVTSLAIAAYTLYFMSRHGRETLLVAFLVVLLAEAQWSINTALRLSTTSPELKVLIYRLNVGMDFGPVAYFVFALAYTDRTEWLTWPRIAAISVLPVTSTVLWFTNDQHGIMLAEAYQGVETVTTLFGSLKVLTMPPISAHSLTFVVLLLYAYVLVLIGAFLIVRMVWGSNRLYQGQAIVLGIGAVLPIILNALYLIGPLAVDVTPLGFAISLVLFGVAIFRYRFLDVVPVARDTVVDTMRDGYVVYDGQGRIVDCNPAAREFLGSSGQIVGKSVTAVFPRDLGLFDEPDRSQTALTVSRDGVTRHYEIVREPLSDPSLDGGLLVVRDVTDTRRAERRFEALVRNALDVILVVDEAGVVSYASPSIERYVDREATTVTGRELARLVHPADRHDLREGVAAASAGDSIRLEFRLREQDPDADQETTWRHVEAMVTDLTNNPAVDGYVLNVRDVTERKRQERELRRANERLERFASVVSHDLRNPLSVAMGHLELARDGRDESLEKIESSLVRMEGLIEDSLEMARTSVTVEDTSEVSIGTVAEEAWRFVDTAEMTLAVEDSGTVQADRDRLLRLFENLFRNAREHGDAETIRVSGTANGFVVADDGTGIPESEREQVLEAGYSTGKDGTGLGLAIVMEIADAHGWDITVDESADGGACFRFSGVERTTPPAE